MFDCQKLRKVMDESGLTKVELAGLYGVSRQTLYAWCERLPQQRTLAERAEKYTAGLVAAMGKNLLPFSSSLSVAHREELLKKISRHLYTFAAPK